MKTNNELTRLGRLRRAKKIIEQGLEIYDLEIKSIKFLTEDTNIFYKIVDQKNRKYAVKLYEELSSNLDDSITEIYFLKEVFNKTSIKVPQPIQNRNGDEITIVKTLFDDKPSRIAVYSWLEGKEVHGFESLENLEDIGTMMAELHQLSENLEVPEHIKSKKIDKVFYYAGDDFFYKAEQHQHKITRRYTEVMNFIIPKLDKELEALYQEQPMLIHGDFNPWNIRIHKKTVSLLDFEDTALAYPIHDIAIFLYYYRLQDNYEAYKKAFYKGYEKIRKLPVMSEETLTMLMTARDVNFLNYILEVSDDPKDYIERTLKRVESYIANYYPEF